MGAKSPTLHQVADQAGVSIATVSRVARGLGGVSPPTREHVARTIEDLNYRPNSAGRALVRQRHDTLGIVFPGLRGPYYSEVIHGFELEAVGADMSVLILGTEHVLGAYSRVEGIADRTDGLAVMGGTIDDEAVKRLASRGIPLVTMARSPVTGIANVRVDNVASTLALTGHLIRKHGYGRIAFAGDIADSPDKAERWAGFVQAHARAGMPAPEAPLHPAWDHRSGVAAARAVLDMERLPDAVVCGSDEIAIGMLSAFTSAGVRVPHDVAITGWDNISHSEFTSPPLTTVTQPARALGRETARILLRLIRHRDRPPAAQTVLSTEPVIRASCGCRYGPDHAGVHPNR